ncbi:hypothetical protein ACKWTF_011617 [Chironomus riparius]
MKEPIFRNCCCCCDLKVGCCIYVGLSLLVSILDFFKTIGNLGSSRNSIYYDYEYGYRQKPSDIPEWTKYLNILICIVTIITCILFFKGVSAKKPSLLKPFIIAQTFSLVLITIVILFLLPFIGDAALMVFIIAVIPIGICAYLIACVYSLYVSMQNGPDMSAGHVYIPQVVIQSQMPQNYQLQNVYYTANPTDPSYPPSSAPYPPNSASCPPNCSPYAPNTYSPGPYNPNFYPIKSYGPNSLPPNYNAAVDVATNDREEKQPFKY